LIPKGDINMIRVYKTLKPQWDETKLPLQWTSKTEADTKFNSFETTFDNRTRKGASRSSITGDLSRMDKEIDKSIEYIKSRLREQYNSIERAREFYPEFGIVKERSYKLPADRESRVEALKRTTDAVIKFNFPGTAYDGDYWRNISAKYELLHSQAIATDGNVSGNVGTLNAYRDYARKFYACFVLLVKANYPDSWNGKLRDFGFQKEKY
jgi:hypothetical protein